MDDLRKKDYNKLANIVCGMKRGKSELVHTDTLKKLPSKNSEHQTCSKNKIVVEVGTQVDYEPFETKSNEFSVPYDSENRSLYLFGEEMSTISGYLNHEHRRNFMDLELVYHKESY